MQNSAPWESSTGVNGKDNEKEVLDRRAREVRRRRWVSVEVVMLSQGGCVDVWTGGFVLGDAGWKT